MGTLIDANVILRYLLRDNEEMFSTAKERIDVGAFTVPEVIAEVVYVLRGVYQVDRDKIADAVSTLLGEVGAEHLEVLQQALAVYGETKLDFVDCILIARHRVLGEAVFSFDKKLNNHLDS